MSVTDRDRHDLYVAARQVLGPHEADVLMAMLPPAGWADVATKQDVHALALDVHALALDVHALRDEMSARFAAHDARFDQVEARLTHVETRLGNVEGRLERLEAKVAGLLPRFVAANVVSMFGVAGVVLAAVGLD